MQCERGAHVEAGGLELAGGQQPVPGHDPPLGLGVPATGVVEAGPHEHLVQPGGERLAVGVVEPFEPALGAVDVTEQQPGLGLEAHGGPAARGWRPRAFAAPGEHGDDRGHVVPGGDVDRGADELGLGHELVGLPRAVGGGGGADVLAGAVEVVDEQVAAGQAQADLALLEAVAVVAGRDERVLERRPGAVDEAGLEQHLGVVEPGPVTGHGGIHGVGLAHEEEGLREVTVDEGDDGPVVPGLELLVDEAVLDGDVPGQLELGGRVGGVAEAEVALPEVEVQRPLLRRVERRLARPDPSQRDQAGLPVAHPAVQGALLDVGQRHQQRVADPLGPHPGLRQHGQRRVEPPQLELGPRPGDEHPGPHPGRCRVVGCREARDGVVEPRRGLVEPAHLVRAAGGSQQLVGPLERVLLDEGLLRARWPA